MEGRVVDPYEQQLYAVFESCDEGQKGSLDRDGLEQLCEQLQLEEQSVELIECLLGSTKTSKRVTFPEFRDGLLTLLGEGQRTRDSGGRGSPEREVSPKFVFGKKKYGRRSRPESTDQELEHDSSLEESETEIFVAVGGDNKEIIMRSISEPSPTDDSQHPKKRKTGAEKNHTLKKSSSESKVSNVSLSWSTPVNDAGSENSAPTSLGPMGDSEEECLRAAWERLGVGRDGFLDRSELALVCECIGMERVAEEVVQQLFEKLDIDRDGRISFEEFLLLFRSGGSWSGTVTVPPSPKTSGRLRNFQQLSGASEEHQPLSSLDPNNAGIVSSDAVLEAWEAAGVPKASNLLHNLGLGEPQQLSVSELAAVLEEELRVMTDERRSRSEEQGSMDVSCSPHETLLQATLVLYQLEVRCLKSSLEHMSAERDKLRGDIADANERASLLAQEVDDHHARLEESTQMQVKLLEQRHAEQIRQVTEQLGLEREQLTLQSQALERQVAALQDEESRIRNELATLLEENKAMDKENQGLLEQLSASKQAQAQLQEEVESMATLQQRLSELEGSHEQEQVLPLLEKVNELQAENTSLRDRIDELTVEMEDMTVRLSASKLKKSAHVQCDPLPEEGSSSLVGGGGTKRRGDSPLALPPEESSEEESPRLGKVRRCCRGNGDQGCREETLDSVNIEGLQIHPMIHSVTGVEADIDVEDSENVFGEPGYRENECNSKWTSSATSGCNEESSAELARLRLRVTELERELKLQTDRLLVTFTVKYIRILEKGFTAVTTQKRTQAGPNRHCLIQLRERSSDPCMCESEVNQESSSDAFWNHRKVFKGQLKQVFKLVHQQALQELLEDKELMSSLQHRCMNQRVTTAVMTSGPFVEQQENAKDVEQLEQHCRDLKSQLEQIKVEIVKILSEKDACSKENCALKIHISDLKNRLPLEDSGSMRLLEANNLVSVSESMLIDKCVLPKSRCVESETSQFLADNSKACPQPNEIGRVESGIVSQSVESSISIHVRDSSVESAKQGSSQGIEQKSGAIKDSQREVLCVVSDQGKSGHSLVDRSSSSVGKETELKRLSKLEDGKVQNLLNEVGKLSVKLEKTSEFPLEEVQKLHEEMQKISAALGGASAIQKLHSEVQSLTTKLGEAEERCADLEASLELLRQEYEKCEDYWANKLEEERRLYDQEQRLSDEKYAELMAKIQEYEEQCNDSDDSDDRLSTIEERASLEKQTFRHEVTDLEEEYEELRARTEQEQSEKDQELQQLKERVQSLEQRLQMAGGSHLDVAVQVSDLENGSWESDRTFVVELDGARKVSHRTKDSSRSSKSSSRAMAGLSNGYSSSSSPDIEIRRLQELKSQLDEECQILREQKETLIGSVELQQNGELGLNGSKTAGQACRVDISVLQALNSRLRQQEQRCRHLQQALKQQQQHTDTLLRQTWKQHKEELSDLQLVLTTTQDRLAQQTSACEKQMERLARTDLLVKELYVENAYLTATVQRLEQRCHVLAQMTTDSTSV
ncbi:ninein homolog [Anabrus simplex]|uniref:ninein homolog n=1 Tax=Anabrus simplex TaxID=316456 RepID=UPI0035A29840